MKSKFLNIVIRVMPDGTEFDVELPINTKIKDLTAELINTNLIPKADASGNFYFYELISKNNNSVLSEKKSLLDIGIKEGDVLFFVPKIIAGSGSKYDQSVIINVNVHPVGITINLETPISATGLIIKEQIFSKLNLNMSIFENVSLYFPRKAKEILDNQELSDINIQNDEVVILNYFGQKSEQSKEIESINFNKDLLIILGLSPSASLVDILSEVKKLIELTKAKKNIKELIDKWLQELAKAETNKVLNEALKYCRQYELHGFVIQLLQQSSRWHTVHKQAIEGIISHDNFMLELNKINTATVSILFEMEKIELSPIL